jgi:hypothetical protein
MTATARAATLAPPDTQPFTARLAGAGSLRHELEALLATAPDGANADDFRRLLIEENVAGKASVNQRDWMWKRLKLRYALDSPESAEFKAFRWAMAEATPFADRGLVAALMMARTDRLFREAVTNLVAPELDRRGILVETQRVEGWVVSTAREAGLMWSAKSVGNIANHILSSLKDFGMVSGSRERRTTGIRISPVVATFAALLGRAQGLTDRQLLASEWFRFLGTDSDGATSALHAASAAGMVSFRMQADVAELLLPEPGAMGS